MSEVANHPTTLVNIRNNPNYDVYIGRPSPFGNPFKIGRDGDRAEVLARFREYFSRRLANEVGFREKVEALRGKVLGCYCYPMPCHGMEIIKYLEGF